MNWLKKIFKREKTKELYHIKYEKNDAVQLFDELEETAIKKMKLLRYEEKLKLRSEELEIFEKLDESEVNQLVMWVGQYNSILEQKQLLKGRLIKNNRSLLKLSQYESELPELMKEVKHTEIKAQENERDMIYLEDEKQELIEERELLLTGYQFLKGFIMTLVTTLGVLLIIGFAMVQIMREWIWMYFSVTSIVLVLFFCGVMYSKERIEKSLRKNEILQKKVVKYLNSAKIRYFHNKRYLEFQFDKLGVDSSSKLEMYYNRYIKNKNNEKQYNQFNHKLMRIEEDINLLFNKHKMHFVEMDQIEEWVKMPKRENAHKNISEEQDKLKSQIKALETYEEELWKEIYILKEDMKYTTDVDERINKHMILVKDHLDKNLQDA
ncbi:MAG: hypothetical protein ACRCSG_03085 [Cellulosilyticaceae bacterium]